MFSLQRNAALFDSHCLPSKSEGTANGGKSGIMGGVNMSSPPQGCALHTSARAQPSAASHEHEVLKVSVEEKLSADNC